MRLFFLVLIASLLLIPLSSGAKILGAHPMISSQSKCACLRSKDSKIMRTCKKSKHFSYNMSDLSGLLDLSGVSFPMNFPPENEEGATQGVAMIKLSSSSTLQSFLDFFQGQGGFSQDDGVVEI